MAIVQRHLYRLADNIDGTDHVAYRDGSYHAHDERDLDEDGKPKPGAGIELVMLEKAVSELEFDHLLTPAELLELFGEAAVEKSFLPVPQ